ncbi:MAG TPA: hypothetical protein VM325_18550 [Alphaproteobacteria bacterium]|nr:hypothetical protein [Alphaproteobacteria bacterium]
MSTVRYGRILRLPAKLKTEIASYRRGWAAACAKGRGASLGALLLRAERIKTGMIKAITVRRPQGKTADCLHGELSNVYPSFVPAMQGSIIEFEFFEPMLAVFKAHIRLGNAEDRGFFESHTRLFGGDFKAPPWIERTWDYGGCIRLGRWSPHGPPRPGYDFVAAARDIARLKAALRTRWYREKVTTLEARMLRALASLPQRRGGKGKAPLIDACGSKAEAVAAIRQITVGLGGKHSAYRRAAAALRRTLTAIEAGRVRVCEKASCSGG